MTAVIFLHARWTEEFGIHFTPPLCDTPKHYAVDLMVLTYSNKCSGNSSVHLASKRTSHQSLGQTNKMISFSGPPAPIFGGRIQIFYHVILKKLAPRTCSFETGSNWCELTVMSLLVSTKIYMRAQVGRSQTAQDYQDIPLSIKVAMMLLNRLASISSFLWCWSRSISFAERSLLPVSPRCHFELFVLI